ncbi:hypothetical protein KC19_2G286000 [Ceratodon purpureus]|uniref:Uncharacterized protein n=1 Tax=Ceratodon purpureus TaxID=3225 RepID=A0A8T0J0H9_CERPU|nr:hypothetical protein KC19_2G286000 [Ceratodon purpureus]
MCRESALVVHKVKTSGTQWSVSFENMRPATTSLSMYTIIEEVKLMSDSSIRTSSLSRFSTLSSDPTSWTGKEQITHQPGSVLL